MRNTSLVKIGPVTKELFGQILLNSLKEMKENMNPSLMA